MFQQKDTLAQQLRITHKPFLASHTHTHRWFIEQRFLQAIVPLFRISSPRNRNVLHQIFLVFSFHSVFHFLFVTLIFFFFVVVLFFRTKVYVETTQKKKK